MRRSRIRCSSAAGRTAGKMMKDEYIPAPSRNAARLVVHTPRIRIIVMSTSGSVLRTSIRIHPAQTTSPIASRISVLAPPHPQTVVCAIAISTSDMPSDITPAATQFTLPGALIGDSGMYRHVAHAATQVTTSGIQKSQCQPRCWAMIAPMISPTPAPTPRIDDIKPIDPATRSGGNSSRAIENASGKIPPATPWITRATISSPREPDSAASSVPAARISSVHSSRRSLP